MKNFKNIHVGKSSLVLTSVQGSVRPAPIKIKIDPANQEATDEIIPWGTDNLYPQNFFNKKYLKNGAAVGGLGLLKAAINGNGFHLYKKVRPAGSTKIEIEEQLIYDFPEIEQFLLDNNIDKLFFEKITDQGMWQMSFTEHILSQNQELITRAKRHKAAHCRFAKMDEAGVIPFVYINTNWANEDKKYTVKIPYIDNTEMNADEIKEYCKEKKIFNFITCSVQPLVDESYYIKTDWHAVDRNGWMDVANSVPELKQAIFENQQHFKYIVYVSDYYFESFYKQEWDDFDAEKRQSLREELATAIDEHMSGNKAGGRSLTAPIFEEGGKFVKGIEVEPIDNKLKDGSYLPDASAANSEILWAMGVNPAIIGAGTPGGQNLGGSGSNIREGYTVLSANQVPKRVYVLDDWKLWQRFNGWDKNLIGAFPGVNLTTLDKNPSGQENTIHE
jgi:hypothetical protein